MWAVGEGGVHTQPIGRRAGPPIAVPLGSVAVASRYSQHRFGRNPRLRRNDWSYTHGGPHAKAPSGDVQPRAGSAAHFTRSHRIAIVVPIVFRADHARSAADPASAALTRHAALLEVRSRRKVHRRGCMTDDPDEVSHGRGGGRSGFCAPPPFACVSGVYFLTSPVFGHAAARNRASNMTTHHRQPRGGRGSAPWHASPAP